MLSAAALARWHKDLARGTVSVELPRWEQAGRLGLRPHLEAMGLGHAFSRDADFSGIDGSRRLCLSAFLHQARVQVASASGAPTSRVAANPSR